ncbi:MAG: LAGLIDADG family homing endonuclease, partial [Trueperaceae bacterium]
MSHAPAPNDPRLSAFDPHAVVIAERQYFQPGDASLGGLFGRVARWVAGPERDEDREAWERVFYDLMADKRFCPGGRVLAGAATQHGNVLNCFVQDGSPADDGSTEWALRLATKLALVTKVGGGNGLNLDPIRPKRAYDGPCGRLTLTMDVAPPPPPTGRDGTFLDLVHGTYVTRGYRTATFAETSDLSRDAAVRTVGDSVEGIWQAASDAVRAMLAGEDVVLDLSGLRPEGTPVDGSGGTSSGPSSFAVEVFDNFATWAHLGAATYAGPVATLRYVFAPTLRVIRQGGTRRGAGMATLSITHPDVRDFVTAKDLDRERDEGDISTFNISVLVSDAFMAAAREAQRGTLREIADHAWATGEPGLIFLDRINEHNPMRAAYGDIKSTNPCVTADTWVDTHEGARTVAELVDRSFCAVVDGEAYPVRSSGFFSTGVKPVVRVRTKRGYQLRLTRDHRLEKVVRRTRDALATEWTPVADLSVGDELQLADQRDARPWSGPGSEEEGWLLGLLVAGGTFATDKDGVACLDLWGDERVRLADAAEASLKRLRHPLPAVWRSEREAQVRLQSRALGDLASRFGVARGTKTVTDDIERGGHAFVTEFLRGLFDADGSVQGSQEKGVSVRLAQSDQAVLERVQRMLARVGALSTLYRERRPAGTSRLPDGRGSHGTYAVQAQHELVIANDNLAVYRDQVGFTVRAKADRLDAALEAYARTPNRERFVDAIVSIEADGEEEVYDVTVDHVHAFAANGIKAHNCGEIPLYPGEPCDLGAMNLAAYVSANDRGMEGFDADRFRDDVATCVRFLDNVLEVNRFALEDNRVMSMKLRRLGLGVMGMADALIKMGLPYDTD